MSNSIPYQDILQYFVPKYEEKNQKCGLNPTRSSSLKFVDDGNVNIIGVRQYRPYNIPEVKKFKKFINK